MNIQGPLSITYFLKGSLRAVALMLAFTSMLYADDEQWQMPRTAAGHPDLQGIWTNATLTTLERPDNYGNILELSLEEGRKQESNNMFARMRERDSRPTDPNAPAPRAGAGVGGYNSFWMDPGNSMLIINGKYRTSIITDPVNGKVPYSKKGRQMYAQRQAKRADFNNPEVRPLGERCLVGFGSSGGPPILPVLYNNHTQIVQTENEIMILAEMNHDARIIRLNDDHHGQAINPWLGDSVGRWEGDTLVVETIKFHPQQDMRSATRHRFYIPATAKVTERFKRISAKQILYQFTVEDAVAYTQSWSGEFTFNTTDKNIFEYACHEGNYAMPGILAGARLEDE